MSQNPSAARRVVALLPEHVANQIAAGEVVERPASVVKELIENSLDAGARQIEVSIVAGGRQLIQVRDDGCGMSSDDALQAIQRHATSKIRDIHDVEKVATLGFRGEALPSMASVSRFSLLTRCRESLEGFEIQIHGGTILDARPEGCPPGTTVTVRSIFYNVPARRKFLRTEQTEVALIRHMLNVYAIGHPDVGFVLSVDERETLRLPAGELLEDRLRELFGDGFLDGLVALEHSLGEIRVSGRISLPKHARKDRREQFFFINGRPASAAILHYAVQQACKEYFPENRYPALVLFIDLPPDWVDVNVHPTKREVRFRHPGPVRDSVMAALMEAMGAGAPLLLKGPGMGLPLTRPSAVTAEERLSSGAVSTGPLSASPPWRAPVTSQRTFDYRLTPASTTGSSPGSVPADPVHLSAKRSAPESIPIAPEPSSGPTAPWAGYRALGWTEEFFAILNVRGGLVLLDPQSARERIVFERLTGRLAESEVLSQRLLHGETVRMQPQAAVMLKKYLDELLTLGLDVSDLGGDTFLINAMPAAISAGNPSLVLQELAERLEEGGRAGARAWTRDRLAQAAAEVAAPQSKALSDVELHTLLDDLARCEMPYTSPAGRPTVIFMGNAEIRSKFAR